MLWGPRAQQVSRVALAQTHIDCLLVDLREDERFAKVRLEVGTGEAGAILVNGVVFSQADLDALNLIVEESDSPVNVQFWMHVVDAEKYRAYLEEREVSRR